MNMTHRFREFSQYFAGSLIALAAAASAADARVLSLHTTASAEPTKLSKVFYKKVEPLPDSGADKAWAVPQYRWLEASWNADKGSYHVMHAIAHGAPGAQRRRREMDTQVADESALTDHFNKFYEQMVRLGYTYGVPTKLGDNGMSGKGPRLKIGQSNSVKLRKAAGMPPLGS